MKLLQVTSVGSKLKVGALALMVCVGMGLLTSPTMAQTAKNSVTQEKLTVQQQQAKDFYLQGMQYFQSKQKISKADQDKALALITQSANLGYAPAQNALGGIYYVGLIAKQDHDKALEWFVKAANQGDAEAQYKVGQMYTEGKGVMQSEMNAAVWYAKSAAQGYAPAQSYLGILYLFGVDGVEKNHDKALDLLQKAAKQGDKQAIHILNKLQPKPQQ